MQTTITRRFPRSITKAYIRQQGVTQRYLIPESIKAVQENDFSSASPSILPIDSIIAERYRITQQPINKLSGEALIYLAEDSLKEQQVMVKVFYPQVIPNIQVMEKLQGLLHPNLLGLIAFDHLVAKGHEQGQYYQVMEWCRGGTLDQQMPFNETQLVELLNGIVSGLHFCHQQGIRHGDIKPANLFFRDKAKRNVIIGDFGSTLQLHRKSNQALNATSDTFSLDYAAPELLEGKSVDIKTDYYALGITLMHLLLAHSPFASMSEKDILVAHLKGRIPKLEQLQQSQLISERFYQLLQGLLFYQPSRRWGAKEINRWLRGNSSQPLSASLYINNSPYPAYKKATNPKQLAAALTKFNAEQQLFSGAISTWIGEYFDPELAKKIQNLVIKYPDYPSIALVKLRYLLDPEQELIVNHKVIENIPALVQILLKEPESLYPFYQKQEIASWIAAKNLADERTDELLTEIEAIRERLAYNKKAAMMALLYTLDPSQPLSLGENQIKYPGEIKALYIKNHKPLIAAIQEVFFNHRLEEWIRAARFEHWQDDVAFLKACRTHYLGNQKMGTHCVLWYFIPELPFPFAGKKTTQPAELAQLIDQSEQHWQAGVKLLTQGWIRAWLIGSGKIKADTEFDQIMSDDGLSIAAKLEVILQLFNPELKAPELYADHNMINFGEFEGDKKRSRQLKLNNHGRGELYGNILLQEGQKGITLEPLKITGNQTVLNISVDSLGLEPGNYKNSILVKSNGGKKEIVIIFDVVEETDDRSWWEQVIDDL